MISLSRSLRKPGRSYGRAFFALLAAATLAQGGEPAVRFVPPQRGKPLVVEVTGVPTMDLERLKSQRDFDWPGLLSVRVAGATSQLLGEYGIEGGTIRFKSRHVPGPGLSFRAIFDPAKIPGGAGGRPVTAHVTIAKTPVQATTVVEKIYPSADVLPENQLRFYLHFSAPMSRGEAYAHLHLLDAAGKEVTRPFLELGEELWDRDGKRFTLFFHPGRVKRGLKPREELGPILEEGKRYTLVVDSSWPDAEGNPLKSDFRKSFAAAAPDETQPHPKSWKFAVPAAGTSAALELRSPKSLDHALLTRLVWVIDGHGKRVAGKVGVADHETCWSFTPNRPWVPGRYRVVIDTALEDLAGNSVARPFELDLVQPRPTEKSRQVELPFEVK